MAYSRNHRGFLGSVAKDAPAAACAAVPVVLFSHGLGGCATQTLYFTEELARHGYIVAAPDHKDAACAIGSDEVDFSRMRTDQSFLQPQRWSDRSHADRLQDLQEVLRRVGNDPMLGAVADLRNLGLAGHSLGGYTVLGMAGAWPSWRHDDVRAVLAFSAVVSPFVAHNTLGGLAAPVMYQGAMFDWGITPTLEGPKGAFAASPPPKYFVKLKGGTHLEWTNLVCMGESGVVACLKARPGAYLITRYAIEFFDRHLKSKPAALLDRNNRDLDTYRFEVR